MPQSPRLLTVCVFSAPSIRCTWATTATRLSTFSRTSASWPWRSTPLVRIDQWPV
jgi:hypothetical protein